MPQKIIKLNKEARQLLKNGIDKLADAVKVTLGPSGRNAIIGHPYQNPEITNDGVSIANEIYLDDEIEQLGADALKEVCRNTDSKAGDGTTTATVLAQAIISEGFKRFESKSILVEKKINPMALKREIEEAEILVSQELDKLAKVITTKEDMYKVAFVSVESPEIAHIIAEVFDKVGKDGIVTFDDGYGEIESEVVEGFEIEAGLTHEELANTEEKKFVLDKPLILVTNQKIEFQAQLTGLINQLVATGQKNLIVIADDFSKDMISMFLMAKLQGEFNIIAIKAPYFGKKEKMEDIAVALGASFFDKEGIHTIEKAIITELGGAKKIIVDKDKTVIIGAKGDTKKRLVDLKDELKHTKLKYDQENLKKRIAKLGGGIGVIKVGAETETAKGYLKKKIEDAVNATKYALQDGVVKGGGLTLKLIAEKLPENILTLAIQAPYNQIQENAGGNLEISDDILDPVKTTKTALKNACSVASLILTTEVAIADKNKEEKDFTLDE